MAHTCTNALPARDQRAATRTPPTPPSTPPPPRSTPPPSASTRSTRPPPKTHNAMEAPRHHRRVGRRPADALRRDAGHLHDPQPGCRIVRPARRQRARHLPLRRRRLRLQGAGVVAHDARGHVREGGQTARQDRAGARADVQQHRQPRAHLPERRLGADKDGKLAAVKHDAANTTSTFDDFTEASTVATRMLYACDDIQTTQRLVR